MTFRTIHKQFKEDLAKAKADIEKTEKDLADAKHVITSKGSDVSTLKEQVKCVLGHVLSDYLCVCLVCECGVLYVQSKDIKELIRRYDSNVS